MVPAIHSFRNPVSIQHQWRVHYSGSSTKNWVESVTVIGIGCNCAESSMFFLANSYTTLCEGVYYNDWILQLIIVWTWLPIALPLQKQMAGEPWLAPFIMSSFLSPNPRTERDKCNFIISMATWNDRGLNAAEKWQQLGRDWAKYHLNLTCLQETKVAVSDVWSWAGVWTQISAHTTANCQVQRSRLHHCPLTEAVCP